jgi:Ca2+-binding RTX toxin-like protein
MPSPSSTTPTTKINLTGNNLIDPLLLDERWASNSGSSVKLTYSFPWENGQSAYFNGAFNLPYSSNNEWTAEHRYSLDVTQQNAFINALQSWANVANVSFSKSVDNASTVGDIRIAFSSASSLDKQWGYTSTPNSLFPKAGDIWLSHKYNYGSWAQNSYNYESLIHETGHALGLDHPFAGKNVLPTKYENTLYTVMSYTPMEDNYWVSGNYKVYAETPMVLDIQAIQYIYGANYSYNSGNNTYTFDPTKPFYKTLWDGGGNDTISISNFNTDCIIDLKAGSYSSLIFNYTPSSRADAYIGLNNLGIAYDCVIENVIGGSGNDAIFGNSASNILNGGAGNDTLIDIEGNDTLIGGSGIDTAKYFLDKSSFKIEAYSDYVLLTGPNRTHKIIDVEYIEFSDDKITVSTLIPIKKITGTASSDFLIGTSTVDDIWSLSGNDTIKGNGGDDNLNGGPDLDVCVYSGKRTEYIFTSSQVNDTVSNRDGKDTITHVERIRFSDSTIAFDIEGVAGKAYRLYKAALDRTPDDRGLAGWINYMDNGGQLNAVSQMFIDSQEFRTKYGSLDNFNFVNQLYLNVLDRNGESTGVNAWVGALNSGAQSRAQVLVGFSESNENKANVIGQIQNGIPYTEYWLS